MNPMSGDVQSPGEKDVFGSFLVRLRQRRRAALAAGDGAAVARCDAVRAVLRTKLVPLICPEALKLAGDAAQAAYEGLAEQEWVRAAGDRYERTGLDQSSFHRAVWLLKTVGVWPWEAAAKPGRSA